MRHWPGTRWAVFDSTRVARLGRPNTLLCVSLLLFGVAVELLSALPRWVFVGILVGTAASVGVAVVFVIATRVYPDTNESGSQWSTESRRRAEIRQYLDAIGEQYVENATVAGERVAFHLPQRAVAVTFDARVFYALEPTWIHAVLVEHEMPGINLGHRLPFETPTISPKTENRSEFDRVRAAYAVLGLPDSADVDEVQRAYRERIKEVHPDRGGDPDEFKKVREAYDTAKQQR